MLESESDILANATRLHRQTVVLRAMPIGNLTGITEAERAVVDRWYRDLDTVDRND